MDRSELLLLERHGRLSFAELVTAEPKLAKALEGHFETAVKNAIQQRLESGSEALRRAALHIRDLPRYRGEETVAALAVAALRRAVESDHALAADHALAKEIDAIDTKAGPTVAAAAGLDVPVQKLPGFSDDVLRARVLRVAQVLKLPEASAQALADIGSIDSIRNSTLISAVRAGKITADVAGKAGRGVALYGLLDQRTELLEQVAGAADDPAKLVELSDADWERVVTATKVLPPGGMPASQYASILHAKVEATFPTQAVAARLGTANAKASLDTKGTLDQLRKLNDGAPILARDFNSLSLRGLSAAEKKALQAAHTAARTAVRRYPGLRLDAVLDDTSRPPEQRAAEAARRIDQAQHLFADNPQLLEMDLLARSADLDKVAFPAGADATDRARLLSLARGYQRSIDVTGNIAATEALVASGVPSAMAVARSTPEAVASITGLPAAQAKQVHSRGVDIAIKASAGVVNIADTTKGGFGDTAVFNVSGNVADFLKEIPGYADFFGNQDFCDCKHCKSIFGPAAYFVDLMRFVDARVTGVYFAAQPKHRLALRTRRPDLWDRLELTCENTNTEIPYLEVINEVLEDAVARDVGYAGNLANRPALRDRVYGQELRVRVNSFEQPFNLPFTEIVTYLRHFKRTLADLAEASRASGSTLGRLRLDLAPIDFQLITTQNVVVATLEELYGVQLPGAPAIQPLDAQLLLPAMGVTRDQLSALVATRFISQDGAQVIRIQSGRRDANSVQDDIERISGLTPTGLDRMHRFVRLWRATGWQIGELDLVRSSLELAAVGSGLNATLVGGVAQVHRFCDVLNFSVEEAIAMFSTIPERPILTSPPPAAYASSDTTAVFPTPPSPLARLTVSLFDRLFNQTRQVELGGRYPQQATRLTLPALALAPPANVDPNLNRVQAALGTNDDQLYQLVVGLARPLGVVPDSANVADRGLLLDIRNLTLLYRHARLARLLKVSLPDLLAIAALTLTHGFVDSLDDLEAVIRTQKWLANSRWTIAPLVELVRPGLPAIAVTRAALANTAAGTAVTYTVTSFGTALPAETVTFAANASLAGAIADWNAKAQDTVAYRADQRGMPSSSGDRLGIRTRSTGASSGIEITTDATGFFAGPPPLAVTGRDVVYPAPAVAGPSATDLATQLVSDVDKASSLVFTDTVFTRVPTVTDEQSRALIAANIARLEAVDDRHYRLRADYDPAQPLALAGLAAALEPALRDVLAACHSRAVLLGALPGKLSIAPERLELLVDLLGEDLATAAIFAELRDPTVSPAQIARSITRIRRLAALFADSDVFDAAALEFIDAQRASFGIADFDRVPLEAVRGVELYRALLRPFIDRGETPPDLAGMVTRYTNAAGFAAADLEDLSELLNCDVALVRSLQDDLPRVASPFASLEQLVLAVVTSQYLGLGGGVLTSVTSGDYATLVTASSAIQGALRAQYPDEQQWQTVQEPLRDTVLSRQRDGLVSYLLRSRQTYPFKEVNDLYNYYLLDTQLEGVVRTSRVAAAIASVQLYAQRCIMNLEETPAGDPAPVRIPPYAIIPEEWEWRQNYRVWEANRKIFLYPENYLEPPLRDDKTPLFKALEDELLSKPITEEAVREAYARYLRGFDEISSLTIAGSYHERDDANRHDVLHLVGATSDDPPIFYYRRVEDFHFGIDSQDRATRWGAWQRVDLQIPVRVVSPIVFQGQLYIFWIRYVTKSLNQFVDGSSRFAGYNHRAHIEFSKRRLDGTWTSPQAVSLTETPFTTRGDGVVLDPLVPKSALSLDLPFLGEIRLYSNYQPLYDSVAHDQPMEDYTLKGFSWDRVYPSNSNSALSLRGLNFQMWSNLELFQRRIGPRMNYDTVNPPGPDLSDRGVPWFPPDSIEAVLAVIAFILLLGSLDDLDEAQSEFLKIIEGRPRNLLWARRNNNNETRAVHAIYLGDHQYITFDTYAFSTLLLESERIDYYKQPLAAPGVGRPEWQYPQWHPTVTGYFDSLFVPNQILNVPIDAGLSAVNGTFSDAIVQNGRDVFHIGFCTVDQKPYVLRRLGTSVADPLAQKLFNEGLDALLATQYQLQTNEPAHGFALDANQLADRTGTGMLDFTGPMGTYLREIFFHIPFLLADHLNSLGEYEKSQSWYQFLFDPTSSEVITGLPAGLSPEERKRRELDRMWRYREFRNLNFDTLRAQLQDSFAIDAYKQDPFNPHAIARLRLSAYQKAIVMKYIDNLLDWGDDLFAKAYSLSNPEYLREATLKYVLAQELLGKRPAKLGDCGDSGPRRYPDIVNSLVDDSEFLLEVETLVRVGPRPRVVAGQSYMPLWSTSNAAQADAAYAGTGSFKAIAEQTLGRKVTPEDAKNPPAALRTAFGSLSRTDFAAIAPPARPLSAPLMATTGKVPTKNSNLGTSGFTGGLVSQISTVFCIPDNPTLRSYWDRVEDRLYKIHNSLDPDGVFRTLPLFGPAIDPGLLTRAKAAGLGLEDVLALAAGGLPPYRFAYLIEKAKSYASTVQSFGAALLSALEKRDGEELADLRNRHETNLLKLNREIRRQELATADAAVEQVMRQQAQALYKQEYFSNLISTGLSSGERVQVGFRVTATVLRGADAILKLAAGIGYLIPEMGSPFAMKYGGKQLGDSFDAFAQVLASAATVSELVADMSGILAGFDRRAESWKNDLTLAGHEIKVLDRELVVAQLRRDIASKSLDLHLTTEDQHEEILEFYGDKFSGFGLYTFLSRLLQQLHRTAFGNALAVAQMAERAYHYELPGEDNAYVGGDWEGARSGLLSGERLLLDLGRLERSFLERNERRQELTQSFSLEQISPEQLIALRETGRGDVRIPEFFFDLFYPGHYRRQIRAVRVSIPCVNGPYTNISATLTLLGSSIRSDAVAGAAALSPVPLGRSTTVATSSAQNDAGVFELSFRDERYNPFEGAGAISDWRIELPGLLKPFDYRTISDVILTLSYTAERSGDLRATLEDTQDPNGLNAFLQANSRVRAFSLRREFAPEFERLMASETNTAVTFDIESRHLPLWLGTRPLALVRAEAVLVADAAPGAFAISVNNVGANGFASVALPAPYAGLPAVRIDAAFAGGISATHTIVVTNAGGLAAPGGAVGLDRKKLKDIMLVVEYTA